MSRLRGLAPRKWSTGSKPTGLFVDLRNNDTVRTWDVCTSQVCRLSRVGVFLKTCPPDSNLGTYVVLSQEAGCFHLRCRGPELHGGPRWRLQAGHHRQRLHLRHHRLRYCPAERVLLETPGGSGHTGHHRRWWEASVETSSRSHSSWAGLSILPPLSHYIICAEELSATEQFGHKCTVILDILCTTYLCIITSGLMNDYFWMCHHYSFK